MKNIKTNAISIALYIICAIVLYFIIKNIIDKERDKKVEKYEYSYNQGKYQIIKELNTIRDTIYKRSEITKYEIPEDVKSSIDSLTKLANSQAKELKRYVSIYSISDYSATKGKKDTVIIHDKDTIRVYSYSDRWINYKAFAGDSLSFDPLQVKDSLSFFFIDKKIGGKDFKELRVLNHNPYSYIKDIQNINLEQPKQYSPFGIGFSAGATYYQGSIQPYIGFGINYNLIKFEK